MKTPHRHNISKNWETRGNLHRPSPGTDRIAPNNVPCLLLIKAAFILIKKCLTEQFTSKPNQAHCRSAEASECCRPHTMLRAKPPAIPALLNKLLPHAKTNKRSPLCLPLRRCVGLSFDASDFPVFQIGGGIAIGAFIRFTF